MQCIMADFVSDRKPLPIGMVFLIYANHPFPIFDDENT